ncbi:thioredoxin reductase [Daldinia loculata]|uniref:thioredoxin reductase n=1 Tax=Daldinia loculata TaxID=103429 RepID=UPI0020C1CD91|nr:thioredoxin reductase [Daldinia loculata]KAI1647332.1 thioredoxin reductase [Daldinia loculata]
MAQEQKTYDVIIIGGSHAGLSAALTLYRALHTCLIFDDGTPRNALSAQTRLTSGWENQNPGSFREASRKELRETGLVEFIFSRAIHAKKVLDDVFEVIDEAGGKWTSRKILLATGVIEKYPDIPGYADHYGTTIFNCMFCYGYEQRGATTAGLLAVGLLSNHAHALTNARDALKFADTVTIYTDDNQPLAAEILAKLDSGLHVDNRKVKQLHGGRDGSGLVIEFDSGEQESHAFIVHKPDLELDSTLPLQLGCELSPGIGVTVNPPFNSTTIQGVFAAGDCCSPLRNIPNAMSMGSYAGCGLARSIPRVANK